MKTLTRNNKLFLYWLAAFSLVFLMAVILPAHSRAATVTLRPSADGLYTEYATPSSGTHFDDVDEASADDDTTYIETGGADDIDFFDVPTSGIAGGSTINSVTI
ncbi:MAG TPA: hypothetical protein ENI11_01520, partial [Actinobacteria bacterium]|nr:hypothetical protein [Actinomycetota bacterium]